MTGVGIILVTTSAAGGRPCRTTQLLPIIQDEELFWEFVVSHNLGKYTYESPKCKLALFIMKVYRFSVWFLIPCRRSSIQNNIIYLLLIVLVYIFFTKLASFI